MLIRHDMQMKTTQVLYHTENTFKTEANFPKWSSMKFLTLFSRYFKVRHQQELWNNVQRPLKLPAVCSGQDSNLSRAPWIAYSNVESTCDQGRSSNTFFIPTTRITIFHSSFQVKTWGDPLATEDSKTNYIIIRMMQWSCPCKSIPLKSPVYQVSIIYCTWAFNNWTSSSSAGCHATVLPWNTDQPHQEST